MDLEILYEDNHLIAVLKPAGVLTQADKTKDASIFEELKHFLKNKHNKPGNVFLGLLHRLDRPVSGVILFAKTSKGASRLSEQFRNHQIEKVYHAIVAGKPEKEKATLVNYIEKDQDKNRVSVYDSAKKGAQEAILDYQVVGSNENYSLLRVEIKTGKPHQIRAQLSHLGNPILGDLKYGSSVSLKNKGIALSATSLSFVTATDEKIIKVSIPIPAEWKEYVRF